MSHLYELSEQYAELLRLIDDAPEGMPPEVLADTLEGIQGLFAAKAVNVARVILHLEAMANARREAANKIIAKANRDDAAAARLTEYLLHHMRATNEQEIADAVVGIKVRVNPDKVEILDADAVPITLKTAPKPPEPAPDKRAILKALKEGVAVPGARLAEKTYRLEIK